MIKVLLDAWKEYTTQQKALRQMAKMEWSVEFLTAMLRKAAKAEGHNLEMTLGNGQQWIRIRTTDKDIKETQADNIFDHLDDDIKIRQFMESLRK